MKFNSIGMAAHIAAAAPGGAHYDPAMTHAQRSCIGNLTFEPWVGQSIRHLPYFDRFYSLCAAIHQGRGIDSSLEIDGRDLVRCSSLTLMAPDEVRDVLG